MGSERPVLRLVRGGAGKGAPSDPPPTPKAEPSRRWWVLPMIVAAVVFLLFFLLLMRKTPTTEGGADLEMEMDTTGAFRVRSATDGYLLIYQQDEKGEIHPCDPGPSGLRAAPLFRSAEFQTLPFQQTDSAGTFVAVRCDQIFDLSKVSGGTFPEGCTEVRRDFRQNTR